jgi:hypothetical protein
MKQTLTDIQVEYDEPIPIYCDNNKHHQYLEEPGDAIQDEAHSNQVSLSMGVGCRKEHQS